MTTQKNTNTPVVRLHSHPRLALLVTAVVIANEVSAYEPMWRVRLDSKDGHTLAQTLEADGFDVLEHATTKTSVELIIDGYDQARLLDDGLAPEVLETGRPFRHNSGISAVQPGYPDLAQLIEHMYAVEAAHPGIAQVVNLTTTYGVAPTWEGRHMFALKISDNVLSREDEPTALLVSGHHARELVPPVIALDAIDRLVAGYGVDSSITQLVDRYEIWVAPTWNPDGYEYVFSVNNMWRKNRRVFVDGVGVDLNRNYDVGWSALCAGSTMTTSATYKGPSSSSEAETLTMAAWVADRQFARVLDFHSAGRLVMWGYACSTHPWNADLEARGIALSQNASYGGDAELPPALGMQYQWQLKRGAEAFLIETQSVFQPSYEDAVAEAEMLWPATTAFLGRTIPITGHVIDSCTGQPVVASIGFPDVSFTLGEVHMSSETFGRYDLFPPTGTHRIHYTAPGYQLVERFVTVVDGVEHVEEVMLSPTNGCAFPVCGNGVAEGGEQCDDGNAVDGDGCRTDCTIELCGDGILDPFEQCDDGNTSDGDGCTSQCSYSCFPGAETRGRGAPHPSK